MRAPDTIDLQAVTTHLRAGLGEVVGRLRARDALVLAGFSSPSFQRKRLVVLAMHDLGWERARARFHGVLSHAYVRGTQLEREGIIDVVRGADGQPRMKRSEP